MLNKVARLAAGASVPLTYEVTRSTESTGQALNVRFMVTFRQRISPGADEVSEVVVASVTVKAAASLPVVQAKIESNIQTINENRPGEGALVITNLREADVRVNAIDVTAPTSVQVTLVCPGGAQLTTSGTTRRFSACPFTVGARSQEVLPMRLEAPESVTPGPRSVVVRVEASVPETRISASAVATVAFTVDVFAESDILKAVGVPVFLVLPGVLVVLTIWFLVATLSPWRQVASRLPPDNVIATATTTAVLGLAVSLAVAALYPKLTSSLVPGHERNYLKTYGFRDFYYAFGYSFAIAVALWVLSLLGFLMFGVGVRWLLVPSPGDDEVALLRKLGLRGLVGGGTIFQQGAKSGASHEKGLEFNNRRNGKLLVVPVINVKVDPTRASELEDVITEHVSQGRAFGLWRALRRAIRQEGVELSFAPDYVNEPEVVEQKEWRRGSQSVAFVQVP
jgi:protein-S-isoprenylcysteine O-methyltransferase Ste14